MGSALLLACQRALPTTPTSAPVLVEEPVPAVNPFAIPGNWYRGALHAHTSHSDGTLSPNELVSAHRAQGYNFLSITDHQMITDPSTLGAPGFLLIPGVELVFGANPLGQGYHIVLVGTRRLPDLSAGRVQETLDRYAASGALMWSAHPYWSGMTYAEMLPLQRLSGMEIWNTSANTDLGKGQATALWDDLLARGKRWWGYAVDDTHGINDDAFGGWVWVKAAELSEAAILAALKSGAFYSSSGPQIHDFRVEGGTAYLRCSAVATINLIGQTSAGYQRRAEPAVTIDSFEHRLSGNERYLRAECIDARGKSAWTNPLFL
jgi:hypothetical protein